MSERTSVCVCVCVCVRMRVRVCVRAPYFTVDHMFGMFWLWAYGLCGMLGVRVRVCGCEHTRRAAWRVNT